MGNVVVCVVGVGDGCNFLVYWYLEGVFFCVYVYFWWWRWCGVYVVFWVCEFFVDCVVLE